VSIRGRSLTNSDPQPPHARGQTLLDTWSITAEELSEIVDANPSLRGMLAGYVAEFKLAEFLSKNATVTDSFKHDDHDRSTKGDRVIEYRSRRFVIESKSLQTNSVKKVENGISGTVQVDASDRRPVMLADGSTLNTTCLLVGEFDVLAVNLFAFFGEWRFAFAKNGDLPRSTYRRYSPEQQSQLLATSVRVTWPLEHPFHTDLFALLDELS